MDPFRAEDTQYAETLSAAGAEVELHIYPGAPTDSMYSLRRHKIPSKRLRQGTGP